VPLKRFRNGPGAAPMNQRGMDSRSGFSKQIPGNIRPDFYSKSSRARLSSLSNALSTSGLTCLNPKDWRS